MSRIVAGLERAGLVRRGQRRTGGEYAWRLARKGRKSCKRRMRRVESLAKALYLLSEREQKQLVELVELLQRVIGKL